MYAQAADPARDASKNGVDTISLSRESEASGGESAIAAHGPNLAKPAKPCTNSTAQCVACKDIRSDLQPPALQAAE
ncbi:hypothetical protein ACVWW5_007351 [Bradyrhizobium sp. LM3.4]